MTIELSLAHGLRKSTMGSQYKLEYDLNIDDLDPDRITSGLLSARPSANNAKRFYYAVDTAQIFYDNGSKWILAGAQKRLDVFTTGAVEDGTTNDLSAIQTAMDNCPDGGIVDCSPKTGLGFFIDGQLSFPNDRSITLLGGRARIINGGTGNLFYYNSGVGGGKPKHRTVGFFIYALGGNEGNGTIFMLEDDGNNVFDFIQIDNVGTGFHLQNTLFWTEANTFHDIVIRHPNIGFRATINGSTYSSMASQNFGKVSITLLNSQAATSYGFSVENGCDWYRAKFGEVIIFPNKANSIGFFCDGKMKNASGSIHFEGQSAANNTAWKFGVNAGSNQLDIYSDIRGCANNETIVSGAGIPTGLKTSSGGNAPSLIIPGTLPSNTVIQRIIQEDLSTDWLKVRIDTSGKIVFQFDISKGLEFQNLAPGTGVIAPVGLRAVGKKSVAAVNDATPDVSNTDILTISANTVDTPITDLDGGGMAGALFVNKIVKIRIAVVTMTSFTHDTAKLRLKGGVNWRPAANYDSITFKYNGSSWEEDSRTGKDGKVGTTDADATPSVFGIRTLRLGSSIVAITAFNNPEDDQLLRVIHTSINVEIANNANIQLKGSVNYGASSTAVIGTVHTLFRDATDNIWREESRIEP